VDYFAGRRARWLSPLRVYLICSIAYFASMPVIEAITHRSPRLMMEVTLTNDQGGTTLTPEERARLAAGLPGRVFVLLGSSWGQTFYSCEC
jgi:Protein of unknown function (DUF3667)